MVAINFSVFKDKILNGTKRQTIRLLNIKWGKVIAKMDLGHKVNLQLYWKQRSKECEKLKDVPLNVIYHQFLHEIRVEQALDDGFDSLTDLIIWFARTYPKIDFNEQEVVIIKW